MQPWVLLLALLGPGMALDHGRNSPFTYESHSKMNPYMVGAHLFKQEGEVQFPETKPSHGWEEKGEEMPYTVVQDYGSYELRRYPSAYMVCTYDHVDQAADPLAGLESNNPFLVMMSRRFRKTPKSVMFRRLFKYISGVNQEGEVVEMTRPVSTLHKVEKADRLGNLELQLMCFYLPSKYQPEHSHDENHSHDDNHSHDENNPHDETHSNMETKPAPRHAAPTPPLPMEDSKVLLFIRPVMEVFARRFGGFALTADTWEEQREILVDDLIGKQVMHDRFYSVGYNSPMQLSDRRNEVWVEAAGNIPSPLEVLVQRAEQINMQNPEELDHVSRMAGFARHLG